MTEECFKTFEIMFSQVFALGFLFIGTESCGDFYWRDFESHKGIPHDAISVGINRDRRVYIGQAYIHNCGLMIGPLIKDEKEISVVCNGGVQKTDLGVKILCARDQKKYYWLETTSFTYKTDISGLCPVKGGYSMAIGNETDKIIRGLQIGRLNRNMEFNRKIQYMILGHIDSLEKKPVLRSAWMTEEYKEEEYEVLVYNDYPLVQNS